MGIDRREFLKQASLAGLGVVLSSCGATKLAPRSVPSRSLGYRLLGRTGIKVSELAFGSHMTDENVADPVGRKRQILRALERGVNLYDIYDAHYHQYKPMSRIIKPRRKDFLISLCSFSDIRDEPPGRALKIASEEIDDLLKVFRTDVIDLFRFVYMKNERDSKIKYEAAIKAKEKGKIRAFGIASHKDEELVGAFGLFEQIDFILLPYNFHHDRAVYSKSFPMALERGVGIIAMKPFAAGFLLKMTGDSSVWLPPDLSEYTRLKKIEEQKGGSLAGAILRHILANPHITCAMPAMNSVEELRENLSALEGKELKREDAALLRACDRMAHALGPSYLPANYRWLESEWT